MRVEPVQPITWLQKQQSHHCRWCDMYIADDVQFIAHSRAHIKGVAA
jgi:hypothetical protein